MKLRNVIILLLVLVYSDIYGQISNIRWYNSDNGLPQNSVKDIIKDKHGFLWLATENGLCRYDGNSFLTFEDIKMKNKYMMHFNGSVAQDSIFINSDYFEDALLINNRTVSKALKYKYKIIRDKEIFIGMSKSYYIFGGFDDINNFFLNSKNGRYFVSNESFWFESHNNQSPKYISPSFSKKALTDTFLLDDNVFYIDKKEKKSYLFTPNGLKPIASDALILDKKSIIYWQGVTGKSFLVNSDAVYAIKFEKDKLTLSFICLIPEFTSYNINSIFFDDEYNKLYLGSLTNGLAILNLKSFDVATHENDNFDKVIYAHTPIDSSSVMTPNGKVFRKHGMVKNYSLDLIKDKYGIIHGPDNSFWVKNYTIMYQITNSANNKMVLSDSIDYNKRITAIFDLENQVAAAVEERDWIRETGVAKGELYFFEGFDFKKITEKYVFEKNVSSLVSLGDSITLVGCREGLYLLNRKTKTQKLIPGSEFLSIRNLQQTSSGAIWLMTNGAGLYLFKNNKLLLMPTDKNAALLNTHCILEDHEKNMWISTNNGLFKIPENELLAFAKNSSKKIYYYSYTKVDGFNTNEFNGACTPCGNKLDNGDFTFPSLDGIVFFNPKKIQAYYPKNDLYVERATIDEKKKVTFKDLIELENDFFRAHLFIDIPYFASFENLYIETFLEGKSNKWERIENGIYTLTNLEHGLYKLKIRVLTSPNVTFKYKEINIKVKALFYQKLWFKIVVFFVFLILLFLIYKIRVNYLIINNKKLETLINDNTKELRQSLLEQKSLKNNIEKESMQQKKLIGTIGHDIATPLKYLSYITTEVANMSAKEFEENKELIYSMRNSSEELYNFTNTLKDYAYLCNENTQKEKETFNLFNIIEEKRRLFEEICKIKSIAFINLINPKINIYTNPNILKVILHNLIDNAVKYTDKGEIIVSFKQSNSFLTIEISDTGIGMDKILITYYHSLQLNSSNDKLMLQKFNIGLHLVVQLLPIIEGKISFKKKQPKGTVILLTIKKI